MLGIAAQPTLGFIMPSHSIAYCLQQSSQLLWVSDTPRLDVEVILAHVLKKDRTYLFAYPEKMLDESQATLFASLFALRMSGQPIAHILGVREFWSLELAVNNSTLIPRPDTELLVETALHLFINDDAQTPRRLLDLGTGSGAIALALAHEKKSWVCVAVDKEMAAVALAERNRLQLKLNNVKVQLSDWFSALQNELPFDVIVSNPPYIDCADPHLTQGDLRFEPRSALVAANNGLADLAFIIAEADKSLAPGGWLLVEHGHHQGAAVRELFQQKYFKDIKTLRDLGGNERVTLGHR
jgi:release factor glutamine methyltransferase